jgi:replicative DNA helicase
VASGFVDLDNLTAGFQKSDLIIVAGRPSMGKTAFCLNIAEEVAISQSGGVGIFSLEMSKEHVLMRMLCSQAGVSSRKVRTGHIDKSEWTKLTTAAGVLNDAPIYIDDTPGIPILELRAKARRLKARHDIKLLIVDYLQLVTGPRSDTREREISAISKSLKSLAKELNIPVIAISQLSRAPETRVDKRPVLSDLRESGAIEQDADVVLFIYREERYRRTPETEGRAEIIIGKQRNGPIGKVELAFIKELPKFQNLYRAQISELDEETVVG